ncbi:MAG: alpha-glucosidase/alpha-galactosidase [Thermoproteota archaeon]
MVDVKISIIGAGSAVFSISLIKDLCLTPNLSGSTISLMDINRERLDAVYSICTRYAEETGIKLRLEKTLNRKESLKDADFVVNTVLTASYERLREGWSIARKLGYRFGGSYHIIHDEAFWINFYQFKFFDSLMRDILEICPNAWYIQLANPVLAGVTYLGRKYGNVKTIGLCHGFSGIYNVVRVLGLESSKVSFKIPGVNHFIWLTSFTYKGENAFPLLDDWVARDAEKYWEKINPSSDLGPKAVDLYKRFGVFPIGDTCTPGGGSWPWWYHTDKETERRWRENPEAWWEGFFSYGRRTVEEIMRLSGDTRRVTEVFPAEKSGEMIVPIIESIACNIPRVFQVNIINSEGFVPGVPADFEVEVPAEVSRRGVQGIRVNGLPKPLVAYILRDRVAPVEVELEAYKNGSRDRLLELIEMDPWTKSEEQARSLLNKILSLPHHEEMRQHYK